MTKAKPRPLAGGAGAENVLAWKQRNLSLDLATEQTKSWLSGSAEFVECTDFGGRAKFEVIWLNPPDHDLRVRYTRWNHLLVRR